MFITGYINQQKITKLTLTVALSIIILSCCASITLGAAANEPVAVDFVLSGYAVPAECVMCGAVNVPVNASNALVPRLEGAPKPMQQMPQLIPQQPDTSVQVQDFCQQSICSLLLAFCLTKVYEQYTGSKLIVSSITSVTLGTANVWVCSKLTAKAMAFVRKHQIIS
jgi:hypothetical protein